MNSKRKKIYLDYAASTPVDPRVFDVMKPYFSEKFGNPGSVHSFGQDAIAAADRSRETIARAIGAEFREIIFTGSATEANNLALRGIVKKYLDEFPRSDNNVKPRIIISTIEHESVLETARELEKEGIEVFYVPVNKEGVIDVDFLKKSLNERTILVSVMYANNEVGTIQPITEIAEIISKYRMFTSLKYPFFHTDAVQAFQFLDCDVKKLGVDMMTLSAHKIYGPKGIGCLYSRVSLLSIVSGGGQEFGMRSGTENVPSIVGFAKAVELRSSLLVRSNEQIHELCDYLWRGIKKIFPKAQRNSPASKGKTLPNILNVSFPGLEAQDIITRLDLNGVAVSSGSACRSRALEASHVIVAMGFSKERAKSSIRFSLGRLTNKKEIDSARAALKKILR